MAKKSGKRFNGDGCFQWIDAKKRWCYRITIPHQFSPDGRSIRKSFYGRTQEECRKKAREALNRIETGTPFGMEELTIEQLAMRIEEEKLSEGTTQKQTYARNLETVRRLGPIGQTTLVKANPMMLKSFLISQRSRYSDSILKKEYQMLRRVFREAVEEGIIQKSPMLGVRLPRSEKTREKVRALTKDEQKKLIHVLLTEDIPYSEPMVVSLFTGMRMGEVLALQVRDVNFMIGVIHICKTISRDARGNPFVNERTKTDAGTRDIRVTDDVLDYLRDCIGAKGPDEMIFTKNGKPVSTNTVNTHFSRALKDHGILSKINGQRVTLHSLRHTYATRCIESGMQAKVLQHRLGHTSIEITFDVYGDVFREFEEENLLKADLYFKSEGLSLAPGNHDDGHEEDTVCPEGQKADVS